VTGFAKRSVPLSPVGALWMSAMLP
jgi:hypothetical protein